MLTWSGYYHQATGTNQAIKLVMNLADYLNKSQVKISQFCKNEFLKWTIKSTNKLSYEEAHQNCRGTTFCEKAWWRQYKRKVKDKIKDVSMCLCVSLWGSVEF